MTAHPEVHAGRPGHGSNLGGVNLLGRKKGNEDADDAGGVEKVDDAGGVEKVEAAGGNVADDAGTAKSATAPKGRPTPKRSEATRRRGPVAPAPLTSAEARKRRRERMMSGEDAYLLPRDKGPVRRYARDIVDARRNLLGLFMPAALIMVFVMLSVPSLAVQQAVTPAMLVLLVVMGIDGVFLSRRVNRLVDARFPDNIESGWKLGFYAASRASQLRRMRAPRPQVERGAKVA
jgi:hypothetical protein